MVNETSPHKFVIDVRDEDLFDFDRVGYCKINLDDVKGKAQEFNSIWLKLNGENEAEIEVSVVIRDQKEGEDLYNAVKEGNMDKVKQLLQEKKDINAHYGGILHTPLHVAVITKNETMIKYLLENGAEINRRNNNGDTPLHLATTPELCGLLIQKGADVNLRNCNGDVPLV